MPKVRVNARTNVSFALKLEAEGLRRTFANLKTKGVSSDKIKMLIELKRKADGLAAQADLLTKNGKADAKVVNAKAAKALEFFYENLLRYSN
jgi:SOS response regulatory protein OraA/RecX